MNKTVMLDFIKVIYRMAEKDDFNNCSHFHVTVDECEVRGIIKDMYGNMPKCDYAFDKIGSYVIYDKAGIRINPEKIVKILNDNNADR